jgi:hypothetical protein
MRNEIEVYINWVIVCGQIVWRPQRIPPSKWVAFWERKR